MANLDEQMTLGTPMLGGSGANKKKKRRRNSRRLFHEAENDNLDISDVVIESYPVIGLKDSVKLNQLESVVLESNGVENVNTPKKKKKNKKRKRKKSDNLDKSEALESHLVNGKKQCDENGICENEEVENGDVSKKKRKKENENTDKLGVALEALPDVDGQNQSDKENQHKLMIPESNEVGNVDVPKKKKNKRKRKKKSDSSDKLDSLEPLQVNSHKLLDELESLIPVSSLDENAAIQSKKKRRKKKKKRGKNVIPEESKVLESHPVNGEEESSELKSISESGVDENVGVPKKKKNRKRKKGKMIDSGYVGEDEEREGDSHGGAKRMKVDDVASEVLENSEPVTSSKKRKNRKKNKKRKVIDGVESEEIKEVSEEPEVKRLKVDTESNDAVGTESNDAGGMVVKKKRKKKKKNKLGIWVAIELLDDTEDVVEEQENTEIEKKEQDKIEVVSKKQEKKEIVSEEKEETEIASEEEEKPVIASEEHKETKVVSEVQEKTECASEEQEEIEVASEEQEEIEVASEEQEEIEVVSEEQEEIEGASEEQEKPKDVSEEQEEKEIIENESQEQKENEIVSKDQEKIEIPSEKEVVDEVEQETIEIISEKQEKELKEKTEDHTEEQEEKDITSEKEEEITIMSESEKNEGNDSTEKQGETEILSEEQDNVVTSKSEENNAKKKKKRKKKKAANSGEVIKDVKEDETEIDLDEIDKEPETASEKQETADTDNVEKSESAKKKKKKKKKAKGSLEDIQSACKLEENEADDDQSGDKLEEIKAEGDCQSVNEVEDISTDSKKKKKERKKKKKKKKGTPEVADQSANNSAGWIVSDIKDPSIKEEKNKVGMNESSKIIVPSQVKKEEAIPPAANLSEMYVDPSLKDEVTRCWTEGSPLQKDNGFEVIGQPFKSFYMPDFLRDTDFLLKVMEELSGIDLLKKNNDLYKFHQTPDLKSVSSPYIARLREFLYGDFRKWLSDVTGIELNDTVAMGSSCYGYTDTLLCHDDELEGRRVAYILYLTSPWYDKDGGTLDLYDVDNKGQPRDIVKSLQPKWNTFAFFEVSPVSFHQVREVLSKDKVRLSINGWFHGTDIERPPKHIEVPRPFVTPEHFEEDKLYEWINPSYLDADTQREIRKKFQNDSEIELESFICEEKYQELSAALQSSKLKWQSTGPANKQSCKILKHKKFPDVLAECCKFLKSEALFLILSQLTGLKLHSLAPPDSDPDSDEDEEEAAKDSKPGMTLDIRQWSHGCYTLVRDSDQGNKASLDATLFVNVADEWSLGHGGFTSYIAKGEDEELLTVMPRSNCFALVYRDAETLKFTKYINVSVKELRKEGSAFYDFNCTYKE